MQITVNGERRDVPAALSLDQLLATLSIDPRIVVVEHNRRIIKRPELASTSIQPDDTIEIVRIVGGGSG